MKPTFEELQALCPEADGRLLQIHLDRLDSQYFKRFELSVVARHVLSLSKLTPENPAEIYLERTGTDEVACTVLAFDYIGEFSLLAGLLTGMGFDIHSGEIYTYAPAPDVPAKERRRHRPGLRRAEPDPFRRRRIIDFFAGKLEPGYVFELWSREFEQQLKAVVRLLEQPNAPAWEQARQVVNEKVARRLEKIHAQQPPMLYPVAITLDQSHPAFTRLKIISQDTPGFLYAISNALSAKGIAIEHVRIRTDGNRIEDLIDITAADGRPIHDQATLDRIKLSVLLTKQFTYFLGNAPDPYAALSRFEHLAEDILQLPEHGQWSTLLGDPKILQELSRLLGASDFLWEDMIRLQYETLLPMLSPEAIGRNFSSEMETLPDRLETVLEQAKTLEEKCLRFNEFKDREIFLIDLDHILDPHSDFRQLSENLTYLATVMVRMAVRLNYSALEQRFGKPCTVAGLEARLALLGLGKFGGAALGYASDIELMFVYSDHGTTNGPETISNAEFFEHLVQDVLKFIHTKREGIFNVDLRLRPHGEDGPLACSLESFCAYYGPGGPAHSLERLALVRLRSIGGDPGLGEQLERLRDEFVYSSNSISLPELREIRERQYQEKTLGGKPNAKFSPGALVDLEYDVQILQIMFGQEHVILRTPRIHQALHALQTVGVLQAEETARLGEAYHFLRHLINGLRMLRGNAKDLFLPLPGTDEYQHLARRLGYKHQPGLDPGRQLFVEFETQTAEVRAFAEQHFGRESLPGSEAGNIADLILSASLPVPIRHQILRRLGFSNPERADLNLLQLAEGASSRETFASLAVLAADLLQQKPDPDMALNNWERFVKALPQPQRHFEEMFSQPMRLDLLLHIFSASQFLSNILVQNPEFISRATDSQNLRPVFAQADYYRFGQEQLQPDLTEGEWLSALRRLKRREFLRLGIKDICLHASLPEVTLELSNLADAMVRLALERAWQELRSAGKLAPASREDPEKHFCVFAFGKLGGQELNYSSDIDLLGVYSDEAETWLNQNPDSGRLNPFVLALERMRTILSQYTEDGYVYRVDFRLRPYGGEGQLVLALTKVEEYYGQQAAVSEIQALLKLRPIAGALSVGEKLMAGVRELLLRSHAQEDVAAAIDHTRGIAVRQAASRAMPAVDVKSGVGGIRDIEFLVQGLQLIHARLQPDLLGANTLLALRALAQAGILPGKIAEQLSEHYIYLRRLEHYLQILEDQQIHTLPTGQEELRALARRMHGPEMDAGQFLEQLSQRQMEIREIYQCYLFKPKMG